MASTPQVSTTGTITLNCTEHHGYIQLDGGGTHLCVKIVTSHRSWDRAQSYCKHTGGDLVVLDTAAKATLMRNKIGQDNHCKLVTCLLSFKNILSLFKKHRLELQAVFSHCPAF